MGPSEPMATAQRQLRAVQVQLRAAQEQVRALEVQLARALARIEELERQLSAERLADPRPAASPNSWVTPRPSASSATLQNPTPGSQHRSWPTTTTSSGGSTAPVMRRPEARAGGDLWTRYMAQRVHASRAPLSPTSSTDEEHA